MALALWWTDLNWQSIRKLDAENLGTWLSGVFSPLAFLWLVYTALAQRDELKLQRQELSQNNLTQRQQQEELERQANALDLQSRRLMAQANATYSPVLALHTWNGQADGTTWVQIENLGSQVIDVRRGENVRSLVNLEHNGANRFFPGGDIAPHLPTGGRLGLKIDNPEAPFVLEITRLDLIRVHFTIRLYRGEQRIQVLSAEEAG